MSREQRSSIENAIWLCKDCGSLIDLDLRRFPADELRRWKAQAERSASAGLGLRRTKPSDAIEQMAQAFSGRGTKFVAEAISNVHSAAADALERLDPRFCVTSSFAGNKTTVTISPRRDPVKLWIHVAPQYRSEFQEQFRGLIDFGRPVKIASSAVQLSGSDLISAIRADISSGDLTIRPGGLPCTVTLFRRSATESPAFRSVAASGLFVRANLACNWKADFWGGLLGIDVQINRTDPPEVTFNLTVNIQRWGGADITTLPYFQAIRSLLACMKAGDLGMQLDTDAIRNPVDFALPAADSSCDRILAHLRWIDDVCQVVRYVGAQIRYDHSCGHEDEDIDAVETIVSLLGGVRTISSTEDVVFDIRETNYEAIETTAFNAERSRFETIQISHSSQRQSVRLFGTVVALPSIRYEMIAAVTAMWCSIESKEENIHGGRVMSMSVRLSDGHGIHMSIVNGDGDVSTIESSTDGC